MSTVIWQGQAPAVAQVNTVTVGGTPAVSQVYTVTINGKAVAYTATAPDTNITIAAALQVLLAASLYPEFLEVTWTVVGTAVITGTAATAGVPFTNTSGATGTGTFVTAIATASKGPSDWSTAGDWSTGAVPVSTDSVFLTGRVPIKYGLSAQSAVALTALNIQADFNVDLGLPNVNTAGGSGTYQEYRGTYLAIQASTINVGAGYGPGASRLRLDIGTATATTVNVYGTSTPAADPNGLPALCLKGSNAANVLNLYPGSVGLAIEPGLTCQYATLRVGYETSQANDVQLTVGAGATIAVINANGGKALMQQTANLTTFNQWAGDWTLQGSAGITGTTTLLGGTFRLQSTGTLAAVVLGAATLDCSQDMRAKAITAITIAARGFKLLDPLGTITGPLAITFAAGVGPEDGTIFLGKGKVLTRT